MPLSRKALSALALGATTSLVAGCGSSSHTAKNPTMPVITSGAQIVFPVDAYRHTVQDARVVGAAMTLIIRRCTARYGVDYPQNWPVDGGPQPNGRVYGLIDLQQAEQYGYHGGPVSGAGDDHKVDEPHYTPEQAAIVEGTGGMPPGPGFPAGLNHDGCIGEAQAALGNKSPALAAGEQLIARITSTASAKAAKDQRVIAADAAWSTCMKAAGYDYATPLAANDAGWPPSSITDKERETATADVKCKLQTNDVGIHFGVESVYQQQLMDQNAEALKAYRAALDDQTKKAAATAASGA